MFDLSNNCHNWNTTIHQDIFGPTEEAAEEQLPLCFLSYRPKMSIFRRAGQTTAIYGSSNPLIETTKMEYIILIILAFFPVLVQKVLLHTDLFFWRLRVFQVIFPIIQSPHERSISLMLLHQNENKSHTLKKNPKCSVFVLIFSILTHVYVQISCYRAPGDDVAQGRPLRAPPYWQQSAQRYWTG